MKILLTGIDGYIGTVLGQELIKAGHNVIGLDTGYYSEAWLYDIPGFVQPEIIKKDIRNVTKEDLVGIEAVVHLSELSNDPVGENDPEVTYDINHEGTKKLAKLSKAAGVNRFIYFSSCSVYGASDNIVDENSPTNPLTAYAKSKILNEQFLQQIADNNFSPIIFRNATVYGPSPRLRFDLVVNNLSGLAYTTKEIKMDSDGTPWRPFIHILDACQAVLIALTTKRENIHNQIINIGDTNSNYQIKDIAEVIKNTFPGCSVSLNKNGADKRNYRVNFDKIKKVLPGFSCKYDVATGARQLLDVFENAHLSYEDFESRNYTRLKQIKYLRENNKIDKSFYWIQFMKFTKTKIDGVYIINLEKKEDDRGFLARIWDQKLFKENGIDFNIMQGYVTLSKKRSTIRGFHFLKVDEKKLTKVIRGSVCEVVIDIRKDSPTYMQWEAFSFKDVDCKMLYMGAGIAHAILTIEDNTELMSLYSPAYSPGNEGGIRYNDPSFNIPWPIPVEVVSQKDSCWEDFTEQK